MLEKPAGYWQAPTMPWQETKLRANYVSRAMALQLCVRLAMRVPGNIVEFGVASGASTRVIRRTLLKERSIWLRHFDRKKIFALDSFEGLRESFENAPAGTFAGDIPNIPGVEFVKGYFEDTCTEELRQRVGRVAFAHLDADLYTSTLCALRWLTPLLGTGSILLFDEFTGENQAEARALIDWREETGITLMRLAELDRDPSGFGDEIDRRVIFQVVGPEPLPNRPGRDSLGWKVAYYLGRLGFEEAKARIMDRLY